MGLGFILEQPFAQHALLAAALVAVTCGLVGPFVVIRGMAFAVHGIAELAFTGAAAGLLIDDNPVAGALVGAVIVAALISGFGDRRRREHPSISRTDGGCRDAQQTPRSVPLHERTLES
jgi:zinc/manganese transport system permease protein